MTMTFDEPADFERAPRFLEILVGLVSSVAGLGALALLTGTLLSWPTADPPNLTWRGLAVLALFGILGYLLCIAGWRLLRGRGRKSDGGLLPPVMLRIGGVLFVLGGALEAYVSGWGILRLLGAALMAVTCFGLARYRSRQAQERENARSVA